MAAMATGRRRRGTSLDIAVCLPCLLIPSSLACGCVNGNQLQHTRALRTATAITALPLWIERRPCSLPSPCIIMSASKRQPLLARDEVPLQQLRTAKAIRHSVLRPSRNEYNDETALLIFTSPSLQEAPTLQEASKLSPDLSDTERLPFSGDGSSTPANNCLLPKPLDRQTKPRPRIVFSTEFLLIAGAFASAIYGGLNLIFSTQASAYPALATNCESVGTSGMERGFLVDRYMIYDVSFTRAKLFDLAWDTIVGQGLRFFHAWVLYHVIARCLTATMETETVPHEAYLDLHFSTVSFNSIWSSFSFIFTRKPVRAVRFALWLLFSISYVLSFATIWSAATGYISGSLPTFKVSGITSISTKSPEFTVCWVLEDDRVTPNGTKRVITGPSVGHAFGHNTSNLHKPLWSQGTVQPTRNTLPTGMDDFMDFYSCKFLRTTDWDSCSWKIPSPRRLLNEILFPRAITGQ